MSSVLGIIPARGGSTGIPRKNVRLFSGEPLIVHTVREALKIKGLDRVVVNTDDAEIAEVAVRAGAENPIMRPKSMADTNSPIYDSIKHLLGYLKDSESYQPTYFMILYPTSPLRMVEDVERHLCLMKEAQCDMVTTLCETEQRLYQLGENNRLILVNKEADPTMSPNRQELPTAYRLNGPFVYLVKTESFLKEGTFFCGDVRAVVCDKWRSVELDDPEDFAMAEVLFKHWTDVESRRRELKELPGSDK